MYIIEILTKKNFLDIDFSLYIILPASCAIHPKSCPSGLGSILKLVCKICNCSRVNAVRIRLVSLCLQPGRQDFFVI